MQRSVTGDRQVWGQQKTNFGDRRLKAKITAGQVSTQCELCDICSFFSALAHPTKFLLGRASLATQ